MHMSKQQLIEWIKNNPTTTALQAVTMVTVYERYSHAKPATFDSLNDCIMIDCGSIWLGIEKDGYTHS